jgi:LmbE family N-acetylglucosaminyl deacetylase
MPAPVDILAVSPHPDDAEIGCGGLLLLSARQGLGTAIVDLSEGEKSTRGTPAFARCARASCSRPVQTTAIRIMSKRRG